MKADASRVLVRKHLRPYFTVFLPKQRGCSDNTIQSIHDTWNLFLRYLSAAKGIDNSRLAFSDIDPAVVTGFLDQMEFEKGWKPSTRNQRLSCLRSFFRYAASMEPVLYPCSAAALSYLIQNNRKPIVVTGAQKPINLEITDARMNLRDSLRFEIGRAHV